MDKIGLQNHKEKVKNVQYDIREVDEMLLGLSKYIGKVTWKKQVVIWKAKKQIVR